MSEEPCEHGNSLKSCARCMKTFRAVFDYLFNSPPMPTERIAEIMREMRERDRA